MFGEPEEGVVEIIVSIIEMQRHKTPALVALSYMKSFLLYVHHV